MQHSHCGHRIVAVHHGPIGVSLRGKRRRQRGWLVQLCGGGHRVLTTGQTRRRLIGDRIGARYDVRADGRRWDAVEGCRCGEAIVHAAETVVGCGRAIVLLVLQVQNGLL